MLPFGLRPFFEGENKLVVVRVGVRVYPVRINNDRFRQGWRTFCREHGLVEHCRVVLSCERRWVFRAIALHRDGTPVPSSYKTVGRPWQQVHPVPGSIVFSDE